jgi:hypothetical protein
LCECLQQLYTPAWKDSITEQVAGTGPGLSNAEAASAVSTARLPGLAAAVLCPKRQQCRTLAQMNCRGLQSNTPYISVCTVSMALWSSMHTSL